MFYLLAFLFVFVFLFIFVIVVVLVFVSYYIFCLSTFFFHNSKEKINIWDTNRNSEVMFFLRLLSYLALNY